MSAFKQLTRQDVYITDYLAKKQWEASGDGLNAYSIETLRGFSGSTPGYPYPADYRNSRYQKLVFDSVATSFYRLVSGSISGSTIYSGPYDIDFQTSLDLSGSRTLKKEVGVISIPVDVAGIGIEPGSFKVEPIFDTQDKYMQDGYSIDTYTGENLFVEDVNYWYNSNPQDYDDYVVDEGDYIDEEIEGEYLAVNTGQQRWEIIDDSEGRLVVSGSESSYTTNERYVGDIIYNKGLAILTDPTVARYYSTYSRHKLKWKSKQPIYTYNINCTVRESEFNFTFNPSAVTGSQSFIQSNISDNDFRPYITTIGLYNNAHELLAVAKLNRPVPRSNNVDMTFVIKFDV